MEAFLGCCKKKWKFLRWIKQLLRLLQTYCYLKHKKEDRFIKGLKKKRKSNKHYSRKKEIYCKNLKHWKHLKHWVLDILTAVWTTVMGEFWGAKIRMFLEVKVLKTYVKTDLSNCFSKKTMKVNKRYKCWMVQSKRCWFVAEIHPSASKKSWAKK